MLGGVMTVASPGSAPATWGHPRGLPRGARSSQAATGSNTTGNVCPDERFRVRASM